MVQTAAFGTEVDTGPCLKPVRRTPMEQAYERMARPPYRGPSDWQVGTPRHLSNFFPANK